MITYLRSLFDRRTLDQKIADGIAKQVKEEQRKQKQSKPVVLRIMKTVQPERRHTFDKITNH